jgi:hypothetical protein
MPVGALAAHYREQLIRSGWTLRDEGADSAVAWSRWKLPEDDYEGMIVVTAPLPDLRELTLTMRSPSRGREIVANVFRRRMVDPAQPPVEGPPSRNLTSSPRPRPVSGVPDIGQNARASTHL